MLNREHRGEKCCELIVRRVWKKRNPLVAFIAFLNMVNLFGLIFIIIRQTPKFCFSSLPRCLLAPSAPSFITFSEITSTTLNVSWGFPASPNGVVEGYRVVYEPTAPIQGTPYTLISLQYVFVNNWAAFVLLLLFRVRYCYASKQHRCQQLCTPLNYWSSAKKPSGDSVLL